MLENMVFRNVLTKKAFDSIVIFESLQRKGGGGFSHTDFYTLYKNEGLGKNKEVAQIKEFGYKMVSKISMVYLHRHEPCTATGSFLCNVYASAHKG